jgi:hypothetical protein
MGDRRGDLLGETEEPGFIGIRLLALSCALPGERPVRLSLLVGVRLGDLERDRRRERLDDGDRGVRPGDLLAASLSTLKCVWVLESFWLDTPLE